MYAIAIDLGTTTLAASLIELTSGRRLGIAGNMNPQRRFGADVVARLETALKSGETGREMTELIRAELLRLGRAACETAKIPWRSVKQVAIAGNPAMQHILLGLPLKSLAFPPFRPVFTNGRCVAAAELNWDGEAQVYIFPMPGGFVGGDTVAFMYGILASGSPPPSPMFCLDMGTNGEMALLEGDTIWATSAAAGPAFEGGNLSCGMPALPGAISSLRIEDDRIRIKVIGDVHPAGICGSGAIEAVDELLLHHILEPSGRLRDSAEIPSNLAARIIGENGENAFVLHRDAQHRLLLTQNDIRQIQLAKGAIRAGMEVLSERSRIRYEALRTLLLTGSFGAVLRPEWLKTIGIFDEGMVQITRFIPEGALVGVERALTGGDGFDSVERLGERFRVVPLSGTPLFETMFMKNIDFPRH